MGTVTCPICTKNKLPSGDDYCKKAPSTTNDTLMNYECKYCGKFQIDNGFLQNNLQNIMSSHNNKDKYKLSCYLREQNNLSNDIPLISKKQIETILTSRDKTLQEQFNLLIKNLSTYIRRFNSLTDLDLELLMIDSWIQRNNQYDYYVLGKLFEKAYSMELLISEQNYSYRIPLNNRVPIKRAKDFTIKGLEYLESIDEKNKNSNKIFLAFKFEENKETFEKIKRFIENDIEDIKFQAVIVNQDTTEHNERINDKIIAELKGARMIVADFSAHSPNVYFEAGYAMGMNIPVIWTCHTEHLENMAVTFL